MGRLAGYVIVTAGSGVVRIAPQVPFDRFQLESQSTTNGKV